MTLGQVVILAVILGSLCFVVFHLIRMVLFHHKMIELITKDNLEIAVVVDHSDREIPKLKARISELEKQIKGIQNGNGK